MNLDNVLKSRDIILLTKVHIVKAIVFPFVMYGCESWTIQKAEHWRIDAFKLCCWRRLCFNRKYLTKYKLFLNVLRWKISNMHKSGWSSIINTHELSRQLVSAISNTEPISNRSFFCHLSMFFFFNTVGPKQLFKSWNWCSFYKTQTCQLCYYI